jgi:hypothetical protein
VIRTKARVAGAARRCDSGCPSIQPGDVYLEHVYSPDHDDIGNTRWARLTECAPCAERYGRGELIAARLPGIVRPDGTVYRPRFVKAYPWSDVDCAAGPDQGVVILGTHDVKRAHEFAESQCRYWFMGNYATQARVGWFRLGYESGEQRWIETVRGGRAGVWFTASDDPDETEVA